MTSRLITQLRNGAGDESRFLPHKQKWFRIATSKEVREHIDPLLGVGEIGVWDPEKSYVPCTGSNESTCKVVSTVDYCVYEAIQTSVGEQPVEGPFWTVVSEDNVNALNDTRRSGPADVDYAPSAYAFPVRPILNNTLTIQPYEIDYSAWEIIYFPMVPDVVNQLTVVNAFWNEESGHWESQYPGKNSDVPIVRADTRVTDWLWLGRRAFHSTPLVNSPPSGPNPNYTYGATDVYLFNASLNQKMKFAPGEHYLCTRKSTYLGEPVYFANPYSPGKASFDSSSGTLTQQGTPVASGNPGTQVGGFSETYQLGTLWSLSGGNTFTCQRSHVTSIFLELGVALPTFNSMAFGQLIVAIEGIRDGGGNIIDDDDGSWEQSKVSPMVGGTGHVAMRMRPRLVLAGDQIKVRAKAFQTVGALPTALLGATIEFEEQP